MWAHKEKLELSIEPCVDRQENKMFTMLYAGKQNLKICTLSLNKENKVCWKKREREKQLTKC